MPGSFVSLCWFKLENCYKLFHTKDTNLYYWTEIWINLNKLKWHFSKVVEQTLDLLEGLLRMRV